MSWSIERQLIIEKFAWYKLKGYDFDETINALANDKDVDNELLNEVIEESLRVKQKIDGSPNKIRIKQF
ncbi:hypothetical protein [Paraliobacillus ryukyuensis]|uniref:hypothetical protein n=1 Tax=Paraliobacillus ryukyuensis TaxID=200904 RepID=UPI0009A6223B|nr:hypothetical protein [Paraliobacillus ryukyuensis]